LVFDEAAFHQEQLQKLLAFINVPLALHAPGSPIHDACDLIARALRFHPARRESAAALVRHPYITARPGSRSTDKPSGPIQFDAAAAIVRLDALYGADGHNTCWAFQSQRLSRSDLAAEFLVESTLPAT
jgi:hypothetical protein